jgi:PAS domain S-box-containing protein
VKSSTKNAKAKAKDITERPESRSALRASEIRYRRLFEAAHDGVLILDSASRKIIDVNPFMLELLGYPREELLGKELWQIGLLADETASHAAFRQLQQQGQVRYENLPLQAKSGEKREVEFVSNLYDEAGTQVIQCNIRDITARKQAEDALQASQERLARELAATQQLQQVGALLIQGGDPDALYRRIVDAAVAIMGSDFASFQMLYPERGPDGELCLLAFHGFTPQAASFWEWVRPTSATTCGRALRAAQRVIVPDVDHCRFMAGSEHLAAYRQTGIRAVQSTPLLSRAGGRVIGMLSTHWRAPRKPEEDNLRQFDILARQAADLIERMQAEEAITKLAAVVESSDDAIISKDVNGVITTWNRGAERLFGYTAREAIGQSVTMLIPPDHLDEEPSILKRIRRGESIEHYETVRRRKDGALLNISLTVSPIRNAKGKITGASKIARDISHRKRNEEMLRQAQAELADHAGQLEHLVAERTARLQDTIGELEAFSYSMAHDMRAPLRGMQGFARTLLEEHAAQLDPQGRNYLERIAGSANRMDALIRDVLNYARILRADTPLEPVDLDRLVPDIVATYEDWRFPNAEIKIEGILLPVLGHLGFLTQCISNLIGNAVKFVKPDSIPRIRIWAELRPKSASPGSLSSSGAEGREDKSPSIHQLATPKSDKGGSTTPAPAPSALSIHQSNNPTIHQSTPLMVRLWFEDNGIGIAPKDYDRVFRMFERLNPPKEFEGTGIGLTIVRKAVERMGGRIGFESALGKGSKFWLELKSPPATTDKA